VSPPFVVFADRSLARMYPFCFLLFALLFLIFRVLPFVRGFFRELIASSSRQVCDPESE